MEPIVRKNLMISLKAFVSCIPYLTFLILSILFLNSSLVTPDASKDIFFEIIKYSLYALDVLCVYWMFRKIYGLLDDLDVFKRRKAKDDNED